MYFSFYLLNRLSKYSYWSFIKPMVWCFELFWKAQIISNQSYYNHCLRVAHLLWSLANFCITSKGILLFIQVFPFGKVLVPYRKIEMVIYTVFSFGLRQNFKSNARPFNYGLEKNGWKKSNSELSQLFKTVWNLKIGRGLANGPH